jgi:dTMP kinase
LTLFVSFEGTEGSGKSTQVALLADALRSAGHDVVTTREPGGTALGESLRHILLESPIPVSPEAEAYLMTSARAEHVRQVIRPALGHGAVVLCDRFYDSTFAYQGGGRGLPVAALMGLQDLAVGNTRPDLTVLLDIPVEVGLERRQMGGGGNRIDRESIAFHQRVADWYRREALSDPARWRIVDATLPPHLVHTAVLNHVRERLGVESSVRHGSRAS